MAVWPLNFQNVSQAKYNRAKKGSVTSKRPLVVPYQYGEELGLVLVTWAVWLQERRLSSKLFYSLAVLHTSEAEEFHPSLFFSLLFFPPEMLEAIDHHHFIPYFSRNVQKFYMVINSFTSHIRYIYLARFIKLTVPQIISAFHANSRASGSLGCNKIEESALDAT